MPAPPPLRIAYVVSYFYPFQSGAERQALTQGAELVRRGHEVRVITQMPEGVDLPEVEYVRGIRVERVINPDRRGLRFGLTFVWDVVQALRERRADVDVVHTHQALWEAVATGAARGWAFPGPTVVQPASSGFYGEAEELRRTKAAPVLRRLIVHNTAFVAISSEIEAQWLALGVRPERMHRLASGVDTGRFHPRAAGQARSDGPPRVVFTGRLHPQKNLDVLIEAWPEVVRRTGAHLRLVGEGPERARLRARVAEMGLTGVVQFPGAEDDVADALRGADLFVLPSRCEGMSNSLLEAMATGLPCLVSDVGGNRDLVEDRRSGRLIRPNHVSAWAGAISEAIEDPALASAWGAAALEIVREQYSIPKVVDRYVHLYRGLLGDGGP